jgi:hypothetical protein
VIWILATGFFCEFLKAERYSTADLSITHVGEIDRLLQPLLEVRLEDSMPQHQAPDMFSGICALTSTEVLGLSSGSPGSSLNRDLRQIATKGGSVPTRIGALFKLVLWPPSLN